MTTKTKDDYLGREFVITREYAAPRELVFKAWTDPKHLAQWWGPRGFTNPVCQWDAQPGKPIHVVMRAPNGANYPMGGEFVEVAPPERLVIRCGALDEKGVMLFEFSHAVTFVEKKGITTLTVRSKVVKTTAEAGKYIGGFEAGMTQSLERLAELLAAMAAGPAFLITRVFDAPRELVFKAWTERETLAQWFGPKGSTVWVERFDLRPGGLCLYGIKMPNGTEMWGRWIFREISPPERLVLVNSFSDKDGGVTRHPLSPKWPLELLTTIILEAQGNQTKLTLQWAPLNATPEERQAFDDGRTSMNAGWTGTFDRLDNYLKPSKT